MNISRKIIIVIIILAIFLGLSFIKLPYVLYLPGAVSNLKGKVEVGYGMSKEQGMFLITSVYTLPAYMPLFLYGILNPNISVKKREIAYLGLSSPDYILMLRYLMQESKTLARIVAMRKLGFGVKVNYLGALVIGVMKNMPSYEILKPGDIIVSVDGKNIKTRKELSNLIANKIPGDSVNIVYIRGGKKFTAKARVTVVNGKNIIGIYVYDRYKTVYPFNIAIKIKDFIGNSAGLMFVLEIINQLTEADLTRGRIISGSGIIDINGSVHEVGGIKQKIIAAQKAGASYFLIPKGNYLKLKKKKFQYINIIPVTSVTDAMNKLLKLPMPKFVPPTTP